MRIQKNGVIQSWVVTLFFAALVFPARASAAIGSNTIGGTINTMMTNLQTPLITTIVLIAYGLGFYLVGTGLWALIDSANPDMAGVHNRHAVIKMAAGSAITVLPSLLGIDVETLLGVGTYSGSGTGNAGAVQNCIGTSTSFPLSCVLHNISSNVVPVATSAVFALSWVFAAGLLVSTIYQVAVAQQRGGNDMPRHWKTKLVLVGILANLPFFLTTLEGTLGITGGTITSSGYAGMAGGSAASMLAYQAPVSSAKLTQYAQAISYAFVVISMFGIFYVLYGLGVFINSDHSRTSKFSAVIHIAAGVALANPKTSVCLVVNTLMGNKFGFC